MERKCMAVATSDLPEPVGVLSTTWRPSMISRIASSCAAYRVMPASAMKRRNASSMASGSLPSFGVR
jgi:hypothetical protein